LTQIKKTQIKAASSRDTVTASGEPPRLSACSPLLYGNPVLATQATWKPCGRTSGCPGARLQSPQIL